MKIIDINEETEILLEKNETDILGSRNFFSHLVDADYPIRVTNNGVFGKQGLQIFGGNGAVDYLLSDGYLALHARGVLP